MAKTRYEINYGVLKGYAVVLWIAFFVFLFWLPFLFIHDHHTRQGIAVIEALLGCCPFIQALILACAGTCMAIDDLSKRKARRLAVIESDPDYVDAMKEIDTFLKGDAMIAEGEK